MTSARRLGVVVVVALLSAVGAGACAGDDSGDDSGDDAVSGSVGTEPPTPSTAPAPSTTPGRSTTPTTATEPTMPASVAPGEPLLEGLDPIRVLGPPGADAGPTPAFEWEPVAGAESYRLVVLGPDGPVWAWEGPETKIWLGGFGVEPTPGATRLGIVDETCWSVVGRDAERSIVAASPLLPISPSGAATHTCTPDG